MTFYVRLNINQIKIMWFMSAEVLDATVSLKTEILTTRMKLGFFSGIFDLWSTEVSFVIVFLTKKVYLSS